MLIQKNQFDFKTKLKDESIFNCSSGKLGVRGCFEEGTPSNIVSIRGTYINGFCENEDITYNEKLYGFTEQKQTIVNLPDAQGIEVWARNEKLVCWSEVASDYSYCLDMKNGVVKRKFVYDTGNGEIELSFERLTSFVRQGLFTIKCQIKSIDYEGEIIVKSFLNGDVKNFTNSSDPRVASGNGKMLKVNDAHNDENIVNNVVVQHIEAETINSHRVIFVNVINKISKGEQVYREESDLLTSLTNITISKGERVEFEKYCYYDEAKEIDTLIKAYNDGFEEIKKEQSKYMDDFWNHSRVVVDCDDIKQTSIDYCLYEMLSAAGRDGKTSIAAKGLSGEGYEGHYFWDCEIYIYPFFLSTNKEIAKSLLMFRYSKLEQAKQHARTLGHTNGALYPWRTITGSECSSYFPSGSAQYHINGDIAYAFSQYWNMTKDEEFLPYICEVLLETARLWINVGHYENDLFKIDCVTGPDEYTCLVNNNYYTNAGAANNLSKAYELINILKETEYYVDFVNRTNVSDEELNEFKTAADKMYYPYDEELDIIKQDDSFLNKKKLEIENIPNDQFPLLLHFHPLFLNRHQICKQADAVLATYLFNNVGYSTAMKTLEYYDKITTHDSSLSKCVSGIVAARLGDLSRAKKYLIETLNTDLNDTKGNTRDGLHIANMGGSYRLITDGFAGLSLKDDELSLFPMLPEGVRFYSFPINYKGVEIKVSVDKQGTVLVVDNPNENTVITVYGRKIKLYNREIVVKRHCKSIIFDLDGVVTNTAKYHYQAWKRVADELNVEFNEERNEQFKGVSRKICLEKLLEWGNIEVSQEEFENILIRKNDYYKELLVNLTPEDVLPGIKEFIDELHERGLTVALFSVSKNTDAILERIEMRKYFDVIVTGNDVKHSKPHYEGYLLVADRLKTDPKLCAMVEDSEAGIIGAKNLSMKTIAIMKDNVANADMCFSSTKELINIEEI